MNIFFLIVLAVLLMLLAGSIYLLKKQKKDKDILLDKLACLPEFTPQKTLIRNSKGISIDRDSGKICLISNDLFIVKSFKEIIEAQVVVDEDVITKTSRGSQVLGVAVGSVLAGGVGAIIGGLSGKTSSAKNIKNVSLKLLVNDLDTPVHEVFMMELTYSGATPPEIALKEAESWNDLLKVVVFQNSTP